MEKEKGNSELILPTWDNKIEFPPIEANFGKENDLDDIDNDRDISNGYLSDDDGPLGGNPDQNISTLESSFMQTYLGARNNQFFSKIVNKK